MSLRARPSLSMLSMIAQQSSLVHTPTRSSTWREDLNAKEIVNYDDLQQMPWGQESLFQDFLHLYNNDDYYKRKHELRNRNFARVSTSNVLRRQTSRSALRLDRGLDGFKQITSFFDDDREVTIEEDAEWGSEQNVFQNMRTH